MADVVFVLVVLVFFAFCVLYVRGCDRIVRSDEAGGNAADPDSKGS